MILHGVRCGSSNASIQKSKVLFRVSPFNSRVGNSFLLVHLNKEYLRCLDISITATHVLDMTKGVKNYIEGTFTLPCYLCVLPNFLRSRDT